MTPRVIFLGDCNPDLVLRVGVRPEFGQVERLVSSAELMIGGSASITCCGLARLGLDAGLVARVGDDALGRLQLKRLADAGVRTGAIAIDPDRATGISVVLAEPDDRATLTALGAIGALVPTKCTSARSGCSATCAPTCRGSWEPPGAPG